MNDFDVLVFIRDVMLANKDVDASFVYDSFNLAQTQGDMKALFHRWAVALNNPIEQGMVVRVMEDLLKVYDQKA